MMFVMMPPPVNGVVLILRRNNSYENSIFYANASFMNASGIEIVDLR